MTQQPATHPGPLLEVVDCWKSFGAVHAINGCSLNVEAGTITGLIGPNGAGKTTLFNLITGFQKLTAGRITFRGQRIDNLPPHRIFGVGVIRTFQITRQFTSMSLIENLMLVPPAQSGEAPWASWFWPKRIRRQEAEIYERAEEVLDRVGLTRLRDESAGSLSGGQKKLLELARTLMCDPLLVLLDEPGAGVNPSLTKELMGHVDRLRRERGITFVVIEHDMDLVARLCDTVIVMSDGKQLMQGTPDVVRRDERVLEAYLGRRSDGPGKPPSEADHAAAGG
jgi:branched-chain amino acid transport system ATP-binding protein